MKIVKLILLIVSGFLSLPLLSQEDTIVVTFDRKSTGGREIRLFDRQDILEFTLAFDITTYRRKRSDTEYLDALLTYHLSDTDSVTRDVKLRSRGEMRRLYCDYPPIRLNFRRDSTEDEFSNIDKIKVVTHCKPGQETYILKEFLAYKLYNILTDNSLRVRLARINYVNTAKKQKPVTKYAFLLEPVEFLCLRTGSVEVRAPSFTQKSIRQESMDRMAIFNYMIGNTDWSVPIKHNILVLSQALTGNPNQGVIVPFDFDYAGLVNSDYAVPFEGLGLESVRQRLYLGICRDKELFEKDLVEFEEHKTDFYRTINDFSFIDSRAKKDMINYLEGFFYSLKQKSSLASTFCHECISF